MTLTFVPVGGDEKDKITVQDPDKVLDEVCELIEIQDTVNLDKALLDQVKIFKYLQGLLSKHAQVHAQATAKREDAEKVSALYYNGRLAQAVYAERPIKHPPKTKTELDALLNTDPIVLQYREINRVTERNLSIIEDAMWQLRKRPDQIKHIIEWRKYIENGM